MKSKFTLKCNVLAEAGTFNFSLTFLSEHLAYNREKIKKKTENTTAAESHNISEGIEDEDMDEDTDIDIEFSSKLKMNTDYTNGSNDKIESFVRNSTATITGASSYSDDNHHHHNVPFDRDRESVLETETDGELETEAESTSVSE